MPNIYSTAGSDAWIYKGDSNWSTARDATSGDLIGRTGGGGSRSFTAIQAVVARGTYRVTRSFLFFDTSGISVPPSSATLKIYGRTNSSADFFVVKSDTNIAHYHHEGYTNSKGTVPARPCLDLPVEYSRKGKKHEELLSEISSWAKDTIIRLRKEFKK